MTPRQRILEIQQAVREYELNLLDFDIECQCGKNPYSNTPPCFNKAEWLITLSCCESSQLVCSPCLSSREVAEALGRLGCSLCNAEITHIANCKKL